MMEAVLSHHHDALEQILDIVTKSRGTLAESQREHEMILAAIELRDADAAGASMTVHLDRLLEETRAFSRRGGPGMVGEILTLLQGDGP
jgi:DNA-binding GntR family transcriptional regulator